MVQQRERRFACLASLRPSDRSSEASFVRTFQKPTKRKPVRFTSYAATTRIRRSRSNVLHSAHGIAYAAGQQHSLRRLTRGRSLVRSQPGPSRVLAGKAVGRRSFVILVVGRAARYRATYRHLKSGTSFGLEWVHVTALGLERPAWVSRPVARLRVRWLAAPAGVGLQLCALSCCSAGRDRSLFASRPRFKFGGVLAAPVACGWGSWARSPTPECAGSLRNRRVARLSRQATGDG